MSLSGPSIQFDCRDRLLFARETLQWLSEEIEAIAICFWEVCGLLLLIVAEREREREKRKR